MAGFILLAFAISWLIWIGMAIFAIDYGTRLGWSLYLLASFGPTLAALLMARIHPGKGDPGELLSLIWRRLPSVTWIIVAILLPLALMGIALFLQVLSGGPRPDFSDPSGLGLLLVWMFIRTFFVGGPLGEELGWRGFALPRLQVQQSAFRSSVVLGLIWGLWHAPIYWVPGTGQFAMAQDGQLLFSFTSFVIIVLGVLLAWSGGWPIFGFLQGAGTNWLLVSNLILLGGIFLVPLIYLPRGKVFDRVL